MLKERTKLERKLIVVVIILTMLLISGFKKHRQYIIMGYKETIKIVCPFLPPSLSGPYTETERNGREIEYYKLFCDAITTQ